MEMGLAPARVEDFCRLAVSGKVAPADTLRRRGILSEEIFDVCPLCGVERVEVDHLFLHCKFT